MGRIKTQPSVKEDGGFTLVLNAGKYGEGDNTIYVLPNWKPGRHLAWISRWDGETFHDTELSPALTQRVLNRALGGLDFSRRAA